MTISIGIAGGVGARLTERRAGPRRRRGDVLGEVARPEPDLHLRRARRGRPGAAGADLGRRPGAGARDRHGRARGGDGVADVGHRAAAPLPRPAVAADRDDRRGDGPDARRCPRSRSTGSGPRRSSTTSARSPCPQEILEKPSALTSAEWRAVVQHPRIGQVILEQAAALKDAVPIILHHHERFSGHGYPFGLRGYDIPLGARIVAIADAYDAMTHDRPYKRAMDHESAVARAAAPRRDAVRPGARVAVLRPVRVARAVARQAGRGDHRHVRSDRGQGGAAAARHEERRASLPRSRWPTARRRSPPRAEPRGEAPVRRR